MAKKLDNVKMKEILKDMRDAFMFDLSHEEIKSIEIPESVTTIENNAFGQSALTEITLPCNITRIGGHAFENCTKLTRIISHIPPERLHPTGDGCFNGIPGNCILYVPRGAKAVYESTEGWNMFANILSQLNLTIMH